MARIFRMVGSSNLYRNHDISSAQGYPNTVRNYSHDPSSLQGGGVLENVCWITRVPAYQSSYPRSTNVFCSVSTIY